MEITKEFVQQLKKATRVLFSHEYGKGKIRMVMPSKKVHGKDIEVEFEHEIDSEIMESLRDSEEIFKVAYSSIYCGHSADASGNIFKEIIKANDDIKLVWRPDAKTSTLLKNAGLAGDVLQIRRVRKDTIAYFDIDSEVCRKDSSVRMIRWY